MNDSLFGLTTYLLVLSLLAVGGLNGLLPELHRIVVEQESWLTTQQFSELFALCQAAPGPNSIFITVLGFELGGLAGALITTTAFTLPAFFVAYYAMRLWVSMGDRHWFYVVRRGLMPITVGLILSSAWFIANTTAVSTPHLFVTMTTASLVHYRACSPALLILGSGVFGGAVEWIRSGLPI